MAYVVSKYIACVLSPQPPPPMLSPILLQYPICACIAGNFGGYRPDFVFDSNCYRRACASVQNPLSSSIFRGFTPRTNMNTRTWSMTIRSENSKQSPEGSFSMSTSVYSMCPGPLRTTRNNSKTNEQGRVNTTLYMPARFEPPGNC